jgi:extracellular elastinolytic metalloproteinase
VSGPHPSLTHRLRRTITVFALLVFSTALLLPGSATGIGQVESEGGELLQSGLGDFDLRTGSVAPTAQQLAAVQSLGAKVRWNRFGTPQSLIKYGGYLATGLSGTPEAAARSFISTNKVLFRLSDQGVSNLELLNDSPMAGSQGHAVIFRQRFGGMPAAQDGMITVGIIGGKVAHVSSSAAGDGNAPGAASLSATEAWLQAAQNVDLGVSAGDISDVREENGWTLFSVEGLSHPQRSRLVALPTPQDGVRPAYETIVLDLAGGEPVAYTHFVDAQTGQALIRFNRVDHLEASAQETNQGTFQGNTGANPPCGPLHEFEAPPGTKTIDLVASAQVPPHDIILNLIYVPTGEVVASSDIPLGDNPEVIHYEPPVLTPGTYAAEVCQFNAAEDPFDYVGAYFTQDVAGFAFPYPPTWRVFPANPPLDYSSTDTRALWCWETEVDGEPVPGCDLGLANLAARAPWDHDVRTGLPTFTTKGNQAISGEAWLSPLTPAEQYRPVALDRQYDFPWTNQWFEEKCAQTVFASPERNDIDAATANLFAMHNRMHDWSYFLGFTEQNFNLQDSNFGIGPPGPFPTGRELDPEIGNSQAGAVVGGTPSFTGRDNANQITLNDGIPGITNMYLWQPIAGAFYAPCVDGDYDMSVIGHEYTHAISNRMVGGPDANITGPQGRAMGESWSDLTAVEYLNEYGFVPTAGESPYAVGPYVTGNQETGIRNYNMSASPLNFSDIGYDFVCNAAIVGPPIEEPCPDGRTQVHADGEIWSATNFDIRQELIRKYRRNFPATDAVLQRRCADGELPAEQCPGNRRWAQIMFDAYLLMQPAVSMLDARDAYLAADVMRFGGANQAALWKVFATRGMGEFASTNGSSDIDPVPNFETPLATNEAQITFAVVAGDEGGAPVNAEIFIGDYEAAVTPIADTDPATPRGATAKFIPGRYDLLVRADGHGLHWFSRKFAAGQTTTLTISVPTNWASISKGAAASGEGVNHDDLIDDTEETNWAVLGRAPNVQGATVTVDLSGDGPQLVKFANVSAMLRPADPDNAGDPAGQNRFTALRQFEIQACNADAANCSLPTSFTTIFTSAEDAFPAGIPRPLAPNLLHRVFNVTDTMATHLRLVVLDNQCTGGPAYQGDQDNDPLNNSDCQSGSVHDGNVRAASLEAFSMLCQANGKPTGMEKEA